MKVGPKPKSPNAFKFPKLSNSSRNNECDSSVSDVSEYFANLCTY